MHTPRTPDPTDTTPSHPRPQKIHPGEQSPQSPTAEPTGLMTSEPSLAFTLAHSALAEALRRSCQHTFPQNSRANATSGTPVLVCSGCHNKVQIVWATSTTEFTFSQSRRLEDQDQGVTGLVYPEASSPWLVDKLPFPCILTWSLLCVSLCPNFPLL